MEPKDINALLSGYEAGTLTPAEKVAVEQWYLAHHETDPAVENVDIEAAQMRSLAAMHAYIHPPKTIRWWPGIAVAASIASLLAVGMYLYNNKPAKQPAVAKTTKIVPGRNAATLTLADGRKISLSDAANGELANESGVVISKNKAGELEYTLKDNATGIETLNTLSTANGETWKVNLPDGSTIWLNAGSSIRYSSTFGKSSQRRITLQGEAFFEVAKDAAHPFIVETNGQETEVLGTSFNISAYADDKSIVTSLVDGSVRVKGAGTTLVLKPGQATVLKASQLALSAADLKRIAAWRNGDMYFDGQDLEIVMREIARWYGVEVVFEVPVPGALFGGQISRYKSIRAILELLESFEVVSFEISGRKIIVKEYKSRYSMH